MDSNGRKSFTNRRWLTLALLGGAATLAVVVGNQWREGRRRAAAPAALQRGDFESATRIAQDVLRQRGEDIEARLWLAQVARRRRQFPEAERQLERAARLDQMPEAVAFERELLALHSGRPLDVERFLRVCREHPEAAPSPLILEALFEGALQRLDLRLAQQCVDLWEANGYSPQNPRQAPRWHAEIALRRGDVDAALIALRRAVDAAPEDDELRLRLATLLARQAPREALEQLAHLRTQANDDVERLCVEARCRRALGETEQAAELLDQILTEQPRHFEALLERGQAALELRQFEAAERSLTRAFELRPASRDAGLALARCWQFTGKEKQARDLLSQIARQDEERDRQMKMLREEGRIEPTTP
ncbi:MAG: tetratricopeptide repeat protein [Pirellulales bacterium]